MNNPIDSTSLNDNVITCLLYSSKKQLWIGTSTGGLSRMIKPGIFKSFKGSNALHNYSVQSIEEDSSENLWISTNKGLYKFDPVLEIFYSMDDAEDFIGNEYNWNSSYFDNAGNLYFGSINGVCVFNPNNVTFDKSFPGIKFTNIKVFDKELVAGKEYHGRVLLNKSIIFGGAITLTAKENAFTIDFAAIEYDNAHKIQYKYKLEGFDNAYQITGAKKRNATYTNLPGGKYVFNLTSTNSNGVWNSEFIKLNITVLPPFYKTWWFKWSIFVVVLLMAYLIYKRNIEKHKQIIREEGLMREKKLTVQRNSELRNEIASNTVLLLQKNESFEMIKDKLNALEYNDLNKQKVKELIELVEHQKDVDTYWQQFQFNFDNAYHNLLTRLKETYPDLTKTNLKLCAYLHLNLSSKEIASLMNVTISGIDKARNRLRKKLNLQPTDDLCEFLNSF
jgi:DNA-binding CsgD family transcriptional regulator